MGYNARFTLTWDDTLPEPKIASIVAGWRADHEAARFCLDEDGNSEEPGAWYTLDFDIGELSRRCPDVLFTVDAIGEDGKRWRVVAKHNSVFRIQPLTIWGPTPISPETRVRG